MPAPCVDHPTMTGSTSPPLRLFIALPCPTAPGLRQALTRLGQLPAVRTVSPEQLHITVRFLGNTDPALVPDIASALDKAVAAAALGPIDLNWRALGSFPQSDRRPPNVIFATPEHAAPLSQLADALDQQLDDLADVPPRDRSGFNPHLTLARVRTGRRRRRHTRRAKRESDALDLLRQTIADLSQSPLGSSRITHLQLLASQLTPAGPIHTPQHTAEL